MPAALFLAVLAHAIAVPLAVMIVWWRSVSVAGGAFAIEAALILMIVGCCEQRLSMRRLLRCLILLIGGAAAVIAEPPAHVVGGTAALGLATAVMTGHDGQFSLARLMLFVTLLSTGLALLVRST